MAGLDPAIHVFALPKHFKTWMPVTSTGMTMFGHYLTRSNYGAAGTSSLGYQG
jgi:hypothetical protein